jgi:hypothetical protein
MATISSTALAKNQSNVNSPDSSRRNSLFKVKPYIALEGDNSVSIIWITNQKSTEYVTWSQDGWKTQQKAFAYSDGFRGGNSTIHRIVIKNVDFTKPFFYKVHSRPIEKLQAYKISYSGEEQSLKGKIKRLIGKDGTISWAMFNDVHENLQIYSHFSKHLKDITSFCAFNGDILNHIDDEATIEDRLLTPFSNISQSSNLPIAYIRGNHETRSDFARQLRNYTGLFNGKFYGAFSIGDVSFLFLDSGEDKDDSCPAYFGLVDFEQYIEEQIEFIKKETALPQWKNAKARIVMRHIPYAGPHPFDITRIAKLDAALKNANVTLMMCAHLHRQKWHNPTNARPFPIVIGGGRQLKNGPDGATLTKCYIKGNTLTVNVINTAGKTTIAKEISLS